LAIRCATRQPPNASGNPKCSLKQPFSPLPLVLEVSSTPIVLHKGDYGDYFTAMFGGDKQRYIDAAALDGRLLRDISARVCMVHGRNDLPIPYQATTSRLAEFMPQADVMLFARCGHSPALEHPEKLVALARDFFR
jgi:2-hydroxymuconate-semialdehyde hydrolase